MNMNQSPGLWIVLLLVVVAWNLYDIAGPQDEAPSQGVLILNWILLICGVAGLIGAVMLFVQQRKRESA